MARTKRERPTPKDRARMARRGRRAGPRAARPRARDEQQLPDTEPPRWATHGWVLETEPSYGPAPAGPCPCCGAVGRAECGDGDGYSCSEYHGGRDLADDGGAPDGAPDERPPLASLAAAPEARLGCCAARAGCAGGSVAGPGEGPGEELVGPATHRERIRRELLTEAADRLDGIEAVIGDEAAAILGEAAALLRECAAPAAEPETPERVGELPRWPDERRAVLQALREVEGLDVWTDAPESARAVERAQQAVRLGAELLEREAEILDSLHTLLDGTEWDSDTFGQIAELVRRSGRRIRELDEVEPDEVLADPEPRTCRWCGTTFFADGLSPGDDCGGCRLSDDDLAEYQRRMAEGGEGRVGEGTPRYHVSMLSRRQAAQHYRRVHNVAPEVLLGHEPYTIRVTTEGAVPHTAFRRARELRAWLRARGLVVDLSSGRHEIGGGYHTLRAGFTRPADRPRWFEDFPGDERARMVELRRAEEEAVRRMSFPFRANFGPDPVEVLGLAEDLPCYRDHPAGLGPLMLHCRRADGRTFITFPTGLSVEGRPLVTHAPPRRPRPFLGLPLRGAAVFEDAPPYRAAGPRAGVPVIHWQVDPEPDAEGWHAVRVDHGPEEGGLDPFPVARVYHRENADAVAAAPALLRALQAGIEAVSRVERTWSSGDLAASVRALSAWANRASALGERIAGGEAAGDVFERPPRYVAGEDAVVFVRPEKVVVMTGTSRLLARNFLVVEGERRGWFVLQVVGLWPGPFANDCGRYNTREDAIRAAQDFHHGRRAPPDRRGLELRAERAPGEELCEDAPPYGTPPLRVTEEAVRLAEADAARRPVTDDEEALLVHVSRFGAEGYPLTKLRGGWVWSYRSVKGPPVVFKRKRDAVASVEAFLEVLRRARGLAAQARAMREILDRKRAPVADQVGEERPPFYGWSWNAEAMPGWSARRRLALARDCVEVLLRKLRGPGSAREKQEAREHVAALMRVRRMLRTEAQAEDRPTVVSPSGRWFEEGGPHTGGVSWISAERPPRYGGPRAGAQWSLTSIRPGPNGGAEREVLIHDDGPWDRFPTVTNDAEGVIARLHEQGLAGPNDRVLYTDSEGDVDELLHDGEGRFLGFRPGPRR